MLFRSGFGESRPKIESLDEGEQISITEIQDEVEKTPKNNYDLMRVQTVEHGEMVTMAKAIIKKLQQVQAAVKDEGFSFDKDDPLQCTISTYTSKNGMTGCKSLS